MSKKISIAIDAMGGDNSPDKTIHGIKLFYDILLKINLKNDELKLNRELFTKYFEIFDTSDEKWDKCKKYFKKFYHFCFDIHPKNVIKELKKYNY